MEIQKALDELKALKVDYNLDLGIDFEKAQSEIDQTLQLQQTGVVRSCSHENYTNYCNTDGSYSHKLCDYCFEMFD